MTFSTASSQAKLTSRQPASEYVGKRFESIPPDIDNTELFLAFFGRQCFESLIMYVYLQFARSLIYSWETLLLLCSPPGCRLYTVLQIFGLAELPGLAESVYPQAVMDPRRLELTF